MIEYERLDVPGMDSADPHHSIVDAQVRFRFYGRHTHSAAVAEAESRLALIAGIDIRDMDSTIPVIPPLAKDVRYVDTHVPEVARLAGDYSARVMAALDLIDHGPPTASAEELLGLVKTALTTRTTVS